MSGIIVSRIPTLTPSYESFAAALRLVFDNLSQQLHAYGATLQDIVMLTTSHHWAAPEFHGDAQAQAKVFQAVAAYQQSVPYGIGAGVLAD